MKLPDAVVAVTSEEDLDAALAESKTRPVFLFKHSPTCPVSGAAWAEFRAFASKSKAARGASGPALRVVDVLSARAVSRLAAERTGVRHESPQTLVLRDRRVVAHASHGALVVEWFEDALDRATRAESR